MIQDQFLAKYAHGVNQLIRELKEDLATANLGSHDGLYRAGVLQGRIQGLTEAMTAMDTLCEELDK